MQSLQGGWPRALLSPVSLTFLAVSQFPYQKIRSPLSFGRLPSPLTYFPISCVERYSLFKYSSNKKN